MDPYDTYRSNAAEIPIMRKWVFRALILSLVLHGGLFAFFQRKKLDNFGVPKIERLAPPKFILNQVKIDPKTLQPDADEVRLKLPERLPNETIPVPQEKPEPKEFQLKPQNPEITSPLLEDKPQAKPMNWDKIAKMDANSAGAMEKELNSIANSLFKDSVTSPKQAIINIPKRDKQAGNGIGESEGIPGTRSIDEALAMTGPLPAGDKPIGMPGGALFQYNEYKLLQNAIDDLQKIGELIRRNPRATFSIEGHTDSFGDDEYNRKLSQFRANAVRDWLVQYMGVGPERIQAVGFGNSKLIVPADRSIEEQAPNRRVEIVIKTNRQ